MPDSAGAASEDELELLELALAARLAAEARCADCYQVALDVVPMTRRRWAERAQLLSDLVDEGGLRLVRGSCLLEQATAEDDLVDDGTGAHEHEFRCRGCQARFCLSFDLARMTGAWRRQ